MDPIIFDTGATKAITSFRDDFVGSLSDPSTSSLEGLAAAPAIRGEGEVEWCLECRDQHGKKRHMLVRLPALYVPDSKFRLLPPQILGDGLHGTVSRKAFGPFSVSWRESDGSTLTIEAALHPGSNVPLVTASVPSRTTRSFDVLGFSRPIAQSGFVTDEANKNLSRAQKILLRLHYRLAHINFQTVQWLARRGIFGQEAKAASSCSVPKCHACEVMKARRRASKATTTTPVKSKIGSISTEDLRPGQRMSVDFFKSTVLGRGRTPLKGYLSRETNLVGGMIAVDHASNKIFVAHQQHFSGTAAVASKLAIEKATATEGVKIEAYLGDNDSAFTSAVFQQALAKDWQRFRFCASHAHHQNGKAERAIGTVMSLASVLMYHAWTRWPDAKDESMWPLAVDHAVYIWNSIPNPSSSLSPNDVFSRSLSPVERLTNLHVWGCPAYVLEPSVVSGKFRPKWKPKSRRGAFVGYSSDFASTVGLVLNHSTKTVTPQFHVVYDDWFTTVSSNGPDPPPEWAALLEHSCENALDIDGNVDGHVILPDLHQDWLTEKERQQRLDDTVGTGALPAPAADAETAPMLLPETTAPPVSASVLPKTEPSSSEGASSIPEGAVESNPSTRSLAAEFEREHVPPTSPPLVPSHSSPPPSSARTSPAVPQPDVVAAPPPEPPPVRPPVPSSTKPDKSDISPTNIVATRLRPRPPRPPPTRRQRQAVPPLRTRAGRVVKPRGVFDPSGLTAVSLSQELSDTLGSSGLDPVSFSAAMAFSSMASNTKKKKYTPDLPSPHDALTGPNRDAYTAAMQKEIAELERKGTWTVVPRENVPKGTNIIPGTWAFRCKRLPDGSVKSYKARFCVRGDRQIKGVDYDETYSPVVQWSTVRLLLTLAIANGLETRQVDYVNAFVQADLRPNENFYIEVPEYFQSKENANVVLKLKKSLYGAAQSPLRFFEKCRDGFLKRGFRQSSHDPCAFLRKGIVVLVYVDDCLFFGKSGQALDDLIADLKTEFDLTHEGNVGAFLGIDITTLPDGRFELQQQGLIDKVLTETGMHNAAPVRTPAIATPLGSDPNGESPQESWNYATVIGMLMYLASNSRPDIAFAVHQCARFTHAPRASHEQAVKRILRYLIGTKSRGLVFSPNSDGSLQLDCFVDADFAGLWGSEDDQDPISVKSRTGYVLTLNGCPLQWVSKLQTEIALSTMEAEYIALSQSMRELIPMRGMVSEIGTTLGLVSSKQPLLHSTVFEDNNGARTLATVPRLTPRSKHIAVKYHFFRHHVASGTINVERIDTSEQKADIFTKGLTAETFQTVRYLLMGW